MKPRYVITKSYYGGIFENWICRRRVMRKRWNWLLFKFDIYWDWSDSWLSKDDNKWNDLGMNYLSSNQFYKGESDPANEKYST